jgi:uncharacterized protein
VAEVLIISGAGDYADPWHPFAATSARLAEVITSYGHRVEVSGTVEETLRSVSERQLLVINIGNPSTPRPVPIMVEIQQALLAHLAGGGGLLAMHVSATSFTTMPRWPEILGGHWVRGTTMHPPLDEARIRLRPGPHPIAGDAVEIAVLDERYSYLDVRDDVEVLGEHTYEGARHPMIWAREQGPGRIVYDGLGHDARSYDSPGHLALLGRAVAWLTGEGA